MKVIYFGKNVEFTDAMKEFCDQKLERLHKYFRDPEELEARIVAKIYPNGQKIELTIPAKELFLRAEALDQDFYAAMNLAIDKLEDQMRKHKTKVNSYHKNREGISTIIADMEKPTSITEPTIEILREKTFVLKPMSKEEAVLQMEMLGHDFFVFLNVESDETAVVYKRSDKKYGLIETGFEE